MMSFSQRKGIEPVKKAIQVDSMSQELRNRLWNALKTFYWDLVGSPRGTGRWRSNNPDMDYLFTQLWDSYFKKPIDTLEDDWTATYNEVRTYFLQCAWNKVYDFIEFIAKEYINPTVNQRFMGFCNSILEEEVSAYRFVGGEIAQITAEVEIAEVEKALKATKATRPLAPVHTHLQRALELFADRKSPDYRNSIKESISAVEAICNLITGKPKATLGQALEKIESKVGLQLHGALKGAFDKLYGYTSDAQGIRHALSDEPNLNSEDAWFMLVSCSAFVNYLISKASQARIKL